VNRNILLIFMLLGALPAISLMSLMVFTVDHVKPEWGEYWYIRPLVVIAFAGGAGGACVYFINRWFGPGVGRKIAAFGVSAIVYLIGLWMGTVIGCNGTLWD
jgi:hypothetical protein